MKNKFRFGAVGQGLFYTGSIKDGKYNFVYDCGTKYDKDQPLLHKEINDFRANVNSGFLDFAVISHLHYDHFSGIGDLLNNFHVKKLFLPYLGDDGLFITFVLISEIYANSGSRAGKVTDDGKLGLLKTMLKLYNIPYAEDFEMRIPQVIEYLSDKTVEFCDNDGDPYWKFCFFNRSVGITSAKFKKFYSEISILLQNAGLTVDCQGLISYVFRHDRNLKNIAKIYRDNFKQKLNDTSTVIVHFPLVTPDAKMFLQQGFCSNSACHFCKFPCNYDGLNEVCASMLTGDVSFNAALQFKVDRCLGGKELFVLQVPHHGSKYAWSPANKYISFSAERYVISYGFGNTYKHPHAETVGDIVLNRKGSLHFANQFSAIEYEIHTV